MESHVGLAVYVLACMGMGVPVVLLSARLSAPAVHHLVRETGAKLILVSQRLLPLASEAFPGVEGDGKEEVDENGVAIRPVLGYETVLVLHSSGTSGLPKPIPCSHRYFLGYATCHTFNSQEEAHGLTVSTLQFFHVSNEKQFSTPGSALIAMIGFWLRGDLLIPQYRQDDLHPTAFHDSKGHEILRGLDFVGFSGGMPKASVGDRLGDAGVRLVMQYGATETGPLTPFFIPSKGYDWCRLRLRNDTLGPLQVRLDRVDIEVDQSDDSQADADSQRIFKYKLSLRPFGWQERFELQDLIVTRQESSPEGDIGQLGFTIVGRIDDLICLATGEKVRPTILESLLRQHEAIKDAAAFGDNQFELGVIVEAIEAVEKGEMDGFKTRIWPVIEEAGRQMDAHARITSPAAIMIVPPGALPRSDKGTILRNAVAKKFAKEIADVYQALEANADAPPFDLTSPRSGIRALVADNIKWQALGDDWSDDDDFFARGMDSLQATKLRRLLTESVRATHIASGELEANQLLPVEKITDDFIYLHPSVSKLLEALIPKHTAANGTMSETELIEQLVDKYTGIGRQSQPKKASVVLTGASGSLGSFVLGQLLMDDSVCRVICLNRPGKDNPIEAQKLAMRSRNISVRDDLWSKVDIRQTSTGAPFLGLEESEYERLANEATHIVHIAWPMNFKMGLQSFDASFRSVQNLIQLARKAHFYQPRGKPRVLFISSISTVGNYPLVKGESLVPEITVKDPYWTLELGYAKAKLVCERMIQRAADDYPGIEAGLVRVGQIAGASSGYWNANEHFVAVCASCQKIGMFPELRGIYHLENPVRQSWEEVVRLMSSELQIPSSSIIPLERWLDLVASTSGPDNPAANLINFLRNDFVQMSCGSIVLDTSISWSVCSTMANMGPVGDETVRAYISYWRRIKLLK
ncbi:uncharacterized protein BCR38DRAFT_511934 [Pseudomassariella vexata]|uniref:Carrier domain-containing protein n=1 Tax=Pseudomassariella vexata TaxID=1141098 RepID=A0A1Y2E3M8_9PEZI|nr:uncharacterized protein BCR38DRAFT_511934 [Pseudomassariella vexata]ORY66160.1 hypothetical protein BCR38DRAFT_511934 [Pseudomassariella vexata]